MATADRANPSVALRDLIRSEIRKISREQDQVALGVVSSVEDGFNVLVTIDGFAGGPIFCTWASAVGPVAGSRVVLTSLSGGQHWFVVGVLADPGSYTVGEVLYYTSGGVQFTKADYPGLRAIRVKAQGAGGGGGGAGLTGVSTISGGGGGGAGGYAEGILLAKDLAASYTITVGSGGAGGIGAANGGAGGFSRFGVLVRGDGGTGGGFVAATATVPFISLQGTGGDGIAGDLLLQGGSGHPAIGQRTSGGNAIVGGAGGDAQLGGGGQGLRGPNAGVTPNGYGGGGSGASNDTSESSRNGGAGADGIVIVELLY